MVVAFAVLHGVAWGCAGRSCRRSAPTTSARRDRHDPRPLLHDHRRRPGRRPGDLFADIAGDYRLGFTIIGILAGLGSLFFIVARKPSGRSSGPTSSFAGGAVMWPKP